MQRNSYGFAVGNLRAKEVSLLKNTDLEQLLGAKDLRAMLLFLRDKGFGGINENDDIFVCLEKMSQDLWEYLLNLVPDSSIFSAVIVPNDYHNFKVVLKGIITNREYISLLKKPCLIDTQTLYECVKSKRFDLLNEPMRTAAQRAYDIYTKDNDVQLSEAILDAACMAEQLNLAAAAKIPLLYDIICAQVFYKNVKVALRASRAQKSAGFLDAALTAMDGFDKKRVITAALTSENELCEYLSIIDKFGSKAAMEAYKKSPAEFERFADNYITAIAKRGRFITVGADVPVSYLFARQSEITCLRIIASGIKTGQSENEIRSRLREVM